MTEEDRGPERLQRADRARGRGRRRRRRRGGVDRLAAALLCLAGRRA